MKKLSILLFFLVCSASVQAQKVVITYSDPQDWKITQDNKEVQHVSEASDDLTVILEAKDTFKGDKYELLLSDSLIADITTDLKNKDSVELSLPFSVARTKTKAGDPKRIVIKEDDKPIIDFDFSIASDNAAASSGNNPAICNISSFIPDISSRNLDNPKNLVLSPYTYIYDAEKNVGSLYKRRKNGKVQYVQDIANDLISGSESSKNIFRPASGRKLSLIILNNNSYDSIKTDTSTLQYNINDNYGFSSAGLVNTEGAVAKGSKIKIVSDETLNNLQYQLNTYAQYIHENNITQSQLERDQSFIRTTVSSCFLSKGFNLDTLSKTLVNSFPEQSLLTSDIMDNLRFIMTYSAPLVAYSIDVPNTDRFIISATGYKEGNKKSLFKESFKTSLGFKVDFSGGLIYSKLVDHAYQIINTNNYKIDTTFFRDAEFVTTDSIIGIDSLQYKRIRKEDNGDFSIGVGAFSHFYMRTGLFFNIGLTVGAVIDNDAAVQYLLGGSLLLGEEQRIIINGGWAFGRVKRLNSKYATDTDILPGELTNISDNQLVLDKWDSAIFFGISYNF